MSTRYSALVIISTLAISSCAFADQFQFDSPGSNVWNGVYVNPYYAHQLPGGVKESLQIYCDDWNTDFSGTPAWSATVYSLTAANVKSFKFGAITQAYSVAESAGQLIATLGAVSPDDVYRRYLETAWLDEQFGAAANDIAKHELSAAMWTLFVDPSHVASLINGINSSGAGFVANVVSNLSDARGAVDNPANPYTAAGWDVVVPSNGAGMQEFLLRDAPVPEPSAAVLLGTLVGLLGLTRLRRRRQL